MTGAGTQGSQRAARRAAVRDAIVEHADHDDRITSAALVGSLATDHADEWSDVDLTFGVSGDSVDEVVSGFTRWLSEHHQASVLIDLPVDDTLYRVFLLPDSLQLDLSFTPGGRVRRASPRFQQLFGEHVVTASTPVDVNDLAGWAVLHCLSSRACLARGKPWQALHSVNELRNLVLNMHCAQADLPVGFGRAFDQLPAHVLERFEDTLPTTLDTPELERALHANIRELQRVPDVPLVDAVAPQLTRWTAAAG
jgi:hypothetical protein